MKRLYTLKNYCLCIILLAISGMTLALNEYAIKLDTTCSKSSKPETFVIHATDIKCVSASYSTVIEQDFSEHPIQIDTTGGLQKMFTESAKLGKEKRIKTYRVNFELMPQAGEKFFKFTKANTGKLMQFIYGKKALSTMFIQQPLKENFQVVKFSEADFLLMKKELHLQACR